MDRCMKFGRHCNITLLFAIFHAFGGGGKEKGRKRKGGRRRMVGEDAGPAAGEAACSYPALRLPYGIRTCRCNSLPPAYRCAISRTPRTLPACR